MRRVSWATAALLTLAGSLSSNAQHLTEEQYLEDALASHPAVVAADSSVAAAAGLRRQAGTLANPEISWEREDPDLAARQDTWSLTWRLPLDGRKHRVAASDAAVAASRAMLEATRLEVRLELRELFAAWHLATERAAMLEDHLDRASRLAAQARARADEGEAAGVEARRLELEVEVLSRGLAAARGEALSSQAAARAWSGLVAEGTRPSRPSLSPPPATVDISLRPDLVALAHRVTEAEAHRDLQQRVLQPPQVSVGWLEIRDAGQDFDGPVLSLAMPVPLFNLNHGNRQAAAAEADRARAELEAARRRAAQDAEAALAAYTEIYRAAVARRVDTSESDVVDSVLAAFSAGESTLTDALDVLRTATDARMARIETLEAALAAERALEAAIGRPILNGGAS